MSSELEGLVEKLLLKMGDLDGRMSDIQGHKLFNGQGEQLCKEVSEIHKKVEEMAAEIRNPETGIIVKVNK